MLERVHARAADLGYNPTSGTHLDAEWVAVTDPDEIDIRFAYPTGIRA